MGDAQGRADWVTLAERYCKDVVAGRVVAGHLIQLACRRQLDDLKRWGKSRARARRLGHPYYFSAARARRVCRIYDLTHHVEGEWAGQPIRLEPWQCFVLCTTWGWVRPEGGSETDDPRRFREVLLLVARKNAKTTTTAPQLLYGLAYDGEGGPGVYSAATTRDQARKVWQIAYGMVAASRKLQRDIKPWQHHLQGLRSGGEFRALVSKETSLHSLNSHVVNLDELHVHRDRRVYGVMKTSMSARRQPLLISTSTAGDNTEGICYERRTYGVKVLQGVLEDETFAAFIYEPDEGDDPYAESTWRKGNPNLGVSKKLKFMQDEARGAQGAPQAEADFRRLDCNIWITGHAPWLPIEAWKAAAQPGLDLAAYAGQAAYIGGDLADRDDIASLVLVLVDEDDVITWWDVHFLPEEAVLRRQHGETAHYATWAKAGELVLTPGDFIDHRAVEAQIVEWCERSGLEVRRRYLDQYGGAQILASRLTEAGYQTDITPKTAKSFTDPAKFLEAHALAGKIRHRGNRVMTWMASNVVVSRRVDGSILPKKERSDGKDKIDGIDALCLGLRAWLDDQEEGEGPVLSGMRVLSLEL